MLTLYRSRVVASSLLFAAGIACAGATPSPTVTPAPPVSTPVTAAVTAAPGPLEAAGLRAMIVGLGHEVKDLVTEPGKEKYELKLSKDGLDIPVGAEISPSKNYIWFTANLGSNRPDLPFEEILKKNYAVQPCQFYITGKNLLMIGVAIDNRAVTPAVLRRNMENLANAVASSKTLWMKPAVEKPSGG